MTTMKFSGGSNGFTQRYGKHKRDYTIDLQTEDMVAIAKGPEHLIRRLEAVGEALCKFLINLFVFNLTFLVNKTQCILKNGQIEVLPLINLTKAEINDACRTLITLFNHFFNDKISTLDATQLAENRQKRVEEETRKWQEREI